MSKKMNSVVRSFVPQQQQQHQHHRSEPLQALASSRKLRQSLSSLVEACGRSNPKRPPAAQPHFATPDVCFGFADESSNGCG